MNPGELLLFTVGGLSNAAYLFIVTAGLSLVFGALRVINMAHGSLYMVAALVCVFIANQLVGGFGFWTGLLLALIVTGILATVVEIVVLKRVYHSEHLVQLLATYALSLVIAGAARLVFGASYHTVGAPVPGSFTVLGYHYSVYSIFMIVAAIVIAGATWTMLFRTSLGRNIRAAVSDPELLNASGVNVTRLYTLVFVIGAGLAGLGGVIVAPSQAVSTNGMDTDVLVLAFAISVIGGLGSIIGSLVGAVLVGIAYTVMLQIPATNAWALVTVFLIMTVVLVIRPSGLFGRAEQ